MSYTREDNKFTTLAIATITTGIVLGPFDEAVEAMSYLAGESLSTFGVLGMTDRVMAAANELFPDFPGRLDEPLGSKDKYDAFCAELIAAHGEFQTIPTNAWGMAGSAPQRHRDVPQARRPPGQADRGGHRRVSESIMQTKGGLIGDHTLSAVCTTPRHPFDPDAGGIAVEMDNVTYFFFEDPGDGYRSNLAGVMEYAGPMYSLGGDFVRLAHLQIPVTVRALRVEERDAETDERRYNGAFDGYEFIDRRNGQTILAVGTENADDYYPWFACRWMPDNIDK